MNKKESNLAKIITRPRFIVRRSLRGLQIQVVKQDGNVVAGLWSKKIDAIKAAKIVSEKTIKAGVKQVMFDRGKHKYHGIVKMIADEARKSGLEF